MMHVLVAYGSRYGSTREVAETVAETLLGQGVAADLKPAREVGSLDGYDGVVLGTPLYMGALHKDVRTVLEKNREALATRPLAVFALGPIKADDGLDGSREQLFSALAKAPAPTPVATVVFVGAYDPSRLCLKHKMLTALPASPLHGEQAHDDRDWDAIRAWACETARVLSTRMGMTAAHASVWGRGDGLAADTGPGGPSRPHRRRGDADAACATSTRKNSGARWRRKRRGASRT